MNELLLFLPVVVVAFVLGILVEVGLQVRSEIRWIKAGVEQKQTKVTKRGVPS